jgi:hypothetical protein
MNRILRSIKSIHVGEAALVRLRPLSTIQRTFTMRYLTFIIIGAVSAFHNSVAHARDITLFWGTPAAWQTAVGPYHVIDFTGFAKWTPITDQYAGQGITFTNPVWIHHAGFYSDGEGLLGTDGVRFELDTPHHAVGVDFVGVVAFALYYKGGFVGGFEYVSSQFGPFTGIVSDIPFDEVYLYKPNPPFENTNIAIDTLYWGMPIPAPGAIGLLAIGALTFRSRRRPRR